MTDPTRIANQFLLRTASAKLAAEKPTQEEWAWYGEGPETRNISPSFIFKSKSAEPLAMVLKATYAALGHAMAAQSNLTQLNSADVSPDGNLGGRGYIQTIPNMRRNYANVVEALSALADTLYDETRAPHWNMMVNKSENPAEVKEIMTDVNQIKKDPEGWARADENSRPVG